ncbi:MAG: TonB-dependent receptor [Pseudomonadales bacterium]|nr:TonB-dependent receptor [Pseudomonadales bacterium]
MRKLDFHFPRITFLCVGALLNTLSLPILATQPGQANIEEIQVWGQGAPVKQTDFNSPSSLLTQEDLVSINAATTEDLVNYEPSLVIRRRFIGDANGTIGIRGSNMFQTSRSMVFADGVPLHYFLQTRWSGAPRWSLVSADEIAQIKVIYGPYSAEHSGNAMGGAVNIETLIPEKRRFHAEGSVFNQGYDELGFDKNLNGFKGFMSYGDKFGDFSLYASYNHLENNSQPQTFRYSQMTKPAQGSETQVSGAILDEDRYGNSVLYFADSGSVDTTTDHFKLKLGYELEDWFTLFNIAYEKRKSATDSPGNYLKSNTGDPVWNGKVVQDGNVFDISSRNFTISDDDRQSLLLGGRLQGSLTENWWMELSLSYFEILEDETRSSKAHPEDPAYTAEGQVTDYEDTGWETAELRLQNDRFFGNETLSLLTGIRHEHYSLEINNYNSADYQSGVKTALTNSSGGETMISAVFTQLGWQITDNWDSAFGVRYERWESNDGFYGNIDHIDRSESRTSPKFSLGFNPSEHWTFRYSLAKAYRFPIVEELFQNERTTNGTSLANANLEPEDGLHQNLSIERRIENGYVRLNFFHENIDDVIFAQSTIVDNRSLNTFIPIDTVKTQGVELIYNQFNLMSGHLDIRFNITYTDSEITKNSANLNLEGKTFPRMPEWRGNLLLTYHINDRWDIGGGARYASDSYDDLENRDKADNVFGAQDSYTFINLKTSYRFNDNYRLSLGIDNLTDEIAFVAHPWPGRTFFLEGTVDF